MNELGVALVWCGGQVTLVAALGVALCLAARRLRSPSGASIAIATMLLVAVLTGLAASPWPRWWPSAERAPTAAVAAAAATAHPDEASPAATAATGNWHTMAGEFWGALQDELAHRPARPGAETGWRWPAACAVIFLIGLACGAGRLLLGLRAIHVLRRHCPRIDDRPLAELTETLQAELGCRRTVELRESPRLGTAATVGWLRPLIFLPGDWRQWGDDERRAVLAHELAHIQRNDFLTLLAAQLGLALHFYHPLLHWLAGRLRLEQELAADACAARVAGGPRTYLTTLASMALRRDAGATGWPASTFLPTRGTLLRRIEMLRDQSKSAPGRPGAWRLAMCGLLVVAALLAAGLRGPGRWAGPAGLAQAAPPSQPAEGGDRRKDAGQPDGDRIDLSYVPGEACLVLTIRPAMILRGGERAGLIAALNEQAGLSEMLGLPIEQVEQVTLVALRPAPQPGGLAQMPEPNGQIYRATQPFDWAPLAARSVPDAVEIRYAGQTYYKSATRPGGIAYFRPDDRTIIIDHEANLYRYILRAQGLPGNFAWSELWDQVASGAAAAAIDVGSVRGVFNEAVSQGPQQAPFAAFAPLWEETTAMAAGIRLEKELEAVVLVASPDEVGRAKVAETAKALLTLAGNMARGSRQQAAAAPGADAAAMLPLLDLGTGLLATARIENAGPMIQATATSREDVGQVAAILIPAITAAREAARRAQAMNNLKQLGLAMHNYADTHRAFPPAVLYSPSNVPYSWRVALLPYLEQEALYRQYNFDLPWDSEQNRAVLDKMPAVFRDAAAPSDTNKTSYFALTSPEAVMGDREGTAFAKILDGTSSTLMLVEAQRDIPWTKPEDIPYSASQALPMLGGLRPGGFNALFCDGSVRFISDNVAEAILRALITKAGGEVVPLNP